MFISTSEAFYNILLDVNLSLVFTNDAVYTYIRNGGYHETNYDDKSNKCAMQTPIPKKKCHAWGTEQPNDCSGTYDAGFGKHSKIS